MALPNITIDGGTVVADPELRFIPNGAAVANFRVASNSRRYNKDTNQWEDGDTTFLTCNLWGDAAQNVADTLQKGMRVNLTGKLKQRQYQTKEGENRTVYEVEVFEVGPSLKYATATVNRNPNNGGGSYNQGQGQSQGQQTDPWGGATGDTGGFGQGANADAEPPF